jgi:two-component system chemotaxis response regulator CheB
MPRSVIENVSADYVLPLAAIPGTLVELAGAAEPPHASSPFELRAGDIQEIKVAELDMKAVEDLGRNGKPSAFACPECNGALWEMEEGGLLRFRCRVGHAYTASSLTLDQSDQVEQALWTAFRALEEAAALHRRMAERARGRGHFRVALEHEAAAQNQENSARTLRDVLLKPRPNVESAEREHAES